MRDMTKIFVKQVRSTSRSTEAHVKTLKALGLGRVGKANLLGDSKAVRGMIRHVLHWVEVKHV
jgi:large subunit ribosomal protein L30